MSGADESGDDIGALRRQIRRYQKRTHKQQTEATDTETAASAASAAANTDDLTNDEIDSLRRQHASFTETRTHKHGKRSKKDFFNRSRFDPPPPQSQPEPQSFLLHDDIATDARDILGDVGPIIQPVVGPSGPRRPRHFSVEALEQATGQKAQPALDAHLSTATAAGAGGNFADAEWEAVPPTELAMPVPYRDNEYCFMCDCSQNRMEMISNPRFLALKRTVDDNYGLMDPLQLWTLVQKQYDEQLRPHTIDKKAWSVACIDKHFTVHSPSSVVMLEDSLRTVNSAMQTIKTQGMFLEERASKKRMLDPLNTRLYLTLMAQRRALMQEIQGKRSNSVV